MAPKVAPPVKNAPKSAPQRGDQPGKSSSGRGVKKKEKKEKTKKQLNLKGWLATPADWAKFKAWAEINAKPRKIPEPTPIVRASKPLAKMKKNIEILSRPQRKPDLAETCRMDLGVSKKALTAKPSKRIKILARYVEKHVDQGRDFPIKISPAALKYQATKRIIEISKPHEMPISDHCKFLIESTRDIKSPKNISRQKRLALMKKAIECPDLMTDKELRILMTPTGIYRSALTYEFTPWMKYLALPSYRFLKNREDEDATNWKAYILEENEIRGKKALEEKRKREEKRMKDEEEEAKMDEEQITEENNENADQETQPSDDAANEEEKDDAGGPESGEIIEEKSQGNVEDNIAEKTDDEGKQDFPTNDDSSGADKDNQDDAKSAERKAARNAWRFTPPPFRDDPFTVKQSALKGKVSPRMAELAVRHVRADESARKNPFVVKKSALTGPIPERVFKLAIPNHPRDPVEKPPPREKDAFGRPIYPMPPYGKKMPYVKPYEPGECPEEEKKGDGEEETEENTKKTRKKKGRYIDPIVYEATIDPCIDPERSQRQIKARKAAKEELERIQQDTKENNDEQTPDGQAESPET